MKFKNLDQMIEELAELIYNFDLQRNDFISLVYVYIDDNRKGAIRTEAAGCVDEKNEGEKYLLHTDEAHNTPMLYDILMDFGNDVCRMADKVLGLSEADLIYETRDYMSMIYGKASSDWDSMVEYIESSECYQTKLENYYRRYFPAYLERAEDCIALCEDAIEAKKKSKRKKK